MKIQTTLRVKEDASTGENGFAVLDDEQLQFNTSWNAFMVFHDVFEHYFEGQRPFIREYAGNVSGEAVAIGHFVYYCAVLGLDTYTRVPFNCNGASVERMAAETIYGLVSETCVYGQYQTYGDTFNFPANIRPRAVEHDEYLRATVDEIFCSLERGIKATDTEERRYAKEYRKSLTPKKVLAALRTGYKMAEKMVPDSRENQKTLYDFFEFWNWFCKNFTADECLNFDFDFTVNTWGGKMYWTCLIRGDGDFMIDSRKNIRYQMDREEIEMNVFGYSLDEY